MNMIATKAKSKSGVWTLEKSIYQALPRATDIYLKQAPQRCTRICMNDSQPHR